jgi:hypothetical protein
VLGVLGAGLALGGAALPGALDAKPGGNGKGQNNGQERCTSCCPDGGKQAARVRVIHAVPNVLVDVYIDGALALEDFAFGAVAGFLSIPEGQRLIEIKPAGTSDVAISASVMLKACRSYEISAHGAVGGTLAASVYQVKRTRVPKETARVRVIHNSPDAPPVNIAVTNGPTLIEDLAYPDASAYLEVPAGTYPLEVRIAANDSFFTSLGEVTFKAGTIYDIFAVGLAGSTKPVDQFRVLPLTDTSCCGKKSGK